MAAFMLARDRGVPAMELDVHLTLDGQVVVIHDHETDRVAPDAARGAEKPGAVPGTGKGLEIEKTNWKDLSGLDIGSWKGEEWRGERIPLLSELLDTLGHEAWWDIELKNKGKPDYGLEAAVSRVIRGTRHGAALVERCAISSFNPYAIARFRALDPGIPVGIIWSRDTEVPALLRHGEGRWIGHADFLKPRFNLVTAFSSFRWRRLEGYEFFPWTVDDPVEAARLVGLHTGGIISNRADRVLAGTH
jgi:glycerophosphoryl diester phosphodiesterase